MGKPLLYEVFERPATSSIAVLCGGWWLYIKHKNLQYEDVGISYDKVVVEKQYWRLLVGQLSHIDFVHILFNLTTLWSLGDVEQAVPHGSAYYLRTSFLMLILTGLVMMGIDNVLIHRFRRDVQRRTFAVGYSGVLFAWMTLVCIRHNGGVKRFNVLGLSSIPMVAAPFLYLAITQLLVPKASFWGHLSGIVTGLVLASGIFSGLGTYWTLCLAMWVAIGLLYGLVQQGIIGVPYIRMPGEGTDLEAGSGYPQITPLSAAPVRGS